jgi:hypothetical protein
MKKILVTVLAFGMSACAADQMDNQSGPQTPADDEPAALSEDQVPVSPEYLASDKYQQAQQMVRDHGIPRHAPCGRTGPNIQNQVIADAAAGSGGANQRNGTIAISSTNCPILGVLQPTDDARYFCWTLANDGFTWTFAQNIRTGVRGWTRDNLLANFGSNQNCGF